MPHIAMQKGIFYNAICVFLQHKRIPFAKGYYEKSN